MMEEIWKDIEGYEGLYQISNLGRVKSFHHSKNGKIRPCCVYGDYVGVSLSDFNNGRKRRTEALHKLLLKAFVPNPDNKKEGNHINGIKTDNRLENLEWCTRSENQLHAYKTGLQVSVGIKGELNPTHKLSNLEVELIRNELRIGKKSQRAIAKEFNISQGLVCAINMNKKRAA